MNYSIIIPAKNEPGIGETLTSVANQTIKPALCLVVDDGSTDNTADIIKEYEQKYPFIKYFNNSSAEKKAYRLGGHVVEVFNKGVEEAINMGYTSDYFIKMDADISFDNDFIETIFKRIENIEKVGIVSGTPYYMEDGYKKFENSPDWHTHGQFKIYNYKCLNEIGGLKRSLGWDTADNICALSKGWNTVVYRDINYKMARKVGGKSSSFKGRINHGIGCYILGYNILYLFIKITHDIFKPPYLIAAWYLFYGYCKARFNRYEKILNKEESKTLRKLLWASLSKRLRNKDFIIFQQFQSSKRKNN